MDVILRKDALKRGLSYYFTGRKCRHGHLSMRQTLSGSCVECRKTTHKALYRSHGKKSFEKNGPYWQRVNASYIKGAENPGKAWDSEDIRLILKKDEEGKYVYPTSYLAETLRRSYRAIERARHKYAKPGEVGRSEAVYLGAV